MGKTWSITFLERRTDALKSNFCPFWVILHGWAFNTESLLGPSSPWHQVTFTAMLKFLYVSSQLLWVGRWICQRIPCLFLEISQSDASCIPLSWPVHSTTHLVPFFLLQNRIHGVHWVLLLRTAITNMLVSRPRHLPGWYHLFHSRAELWAEADFFFSRILFHTVSVGPKARPEVSSC